MKKVNLIFLVIILVFFSASVGYFFGKRGFEASVGQTPIDISIENKTPETNLNADFDMFWQVWEDINNKHIDKPLDPQELVYGATKGMVAAVGDPYTLYLNPDENQSNDEVLSGEYEGIGAELTLKDEYVTIVAPFDDSPAKKAGLEPGDIILEVNGEEIFGLNLGEVVKKIKGPGGTSVTLTIFREGEDQFDVDVVRDKITLDTVKFEDKGDGVMYVRISRFGEKTNEEWDSAVRDIVVKYPDTKAIVLDLRRNPGGYLGSAVHVASEFVPKGVVVVEKFSNGTETKIEVDHKGSFYDKKLVVLIDEGSASASEILAGTLREKVDAPLIGQKSFGKGTVQEPIDYNDGSGLNVTIAKWLTPGGFSVHENGLEPDETLEISEEDVENEFDSQLERAIELAKEM